MPSSREVIALWSIASDAARSGSEAKHLHTGRGFILGLFCARKRVVWLPHARASFTIRSKTGWIYMSRFTNILRRIARLCSACPLDTSTYLLAFADSPAKASAMGLWIINAIAGDIFVNSLKAVILDGSDEPREEKEALRRRMERLGKRLERTEQIGQNTRTQLDLERKKTSNLKDEVRQLHRRLDETSRPWWQRMWGG